MKVLAKVIGRTTPQLSNKYYESQLGKKIKMMKRNRPAPKTQIVSLTSEQINQLSTILHYETSITYLQKTDFVQSKKYLQYALNESKSRFPQSISLQMCLMNRLSIIQRLLGQKNQMLSTLENIFLMCLSLKGERSLQTIKHLHNFLVSLIWQDISKAGNVVEFLEESKYQQLVKKMGHLIGIIKFFNDKQDQGIEIIKRNLDFGLGIKQNNINNLGWLKMMALTKGNLDSLAINNQEGIKQLIKIFLQALIEAQKNAIKPKDQDTQIQSNQIMMSTIQKYLEQKQEEVKSKVLKLINTKTKLYGENSHIIMMNIAHAFYLNMMPDEAAKFLKIGIDNSLQFCEPQRVGLSLILLSRLNFFGKVRWENILEDILQNKQMYSKRVLYQCLLSYSSRLMAQKRFYEAEDLFYQSEKIKSNVNVQGIILPDFDFSF